MFHSVLHLVTQARLGLAHQEYNGSAGRILDLSYSCATTSMWFLHRDRLLAPNAISSTDHKCVLEGACARVCILVHVQNTKTSQHILEKSNDRQWNPIWVPVFWVQFPLLKTVESPSRSSVCACGCACVCEGGGNMFNDTCNGDASSPNCSKTRNAIAWFSLLLEMQPQMS